MHVSAQSGHQTRVEVSRTQRLYDGFLKLDQAHFRHEMPDGTMSPQVMRLNVERGDGAGVLLVNRQKNTVVLTRQFRYANWARADGGWVLEIPAGVVGPGLTPETVARNELVEEVGYHAQDLRYVLMFYASPGTSTERVYVFFAEVTDRDRVGQGGGLASEHEYIQVIEMPISQAMDLLHQGQITDAKTVIALQWLGRQ